MAGRRRTDARRDARASRATTCPGATFDAAYHRYPSAPLVAALPGFAGFVWLLCRVAPDARGSGIRQTIAARFDPDVTMTSLASARTAIAKVVPTPVARLFGGSVGRDGPTVRISAGVMAYAHRLLQLPVQASVIVASGAAGIAAVLDMPLAGVTFAIGALAGYEQRMTLPVTTAVPIPSTMSLGIAGNDVYFGKMRRMLALKDALTVVRGAGIPGAPTGGAFARTMLAVSLSSLVGRQRLHPRLAHPFVREVDEAEGARGLSGGHIAEDAGS